MTWMDRSATRLVEAALLLAPWVGTGIVQLATGRSLGTGVQPAFLPLTGLLVFTVAMVARRRSPQRSDAPAFGWIWLLLLAWTLATTTGAWTFDHTGLAGEVGWSKALKQWIVLAFFVSSLLAVASLARNLEAAQWARWERAASVGLALAIAVALVQAMAFDLALPGGTALARITSSNPSIAAGSEELYLGHRFVGIARLRGPMPEPLLFGSYLVAMVPVTAAAAWRARGWARRWRAGVAVVGALCLVATFSRGAWLGGVVTALLLAIGSGRSVLPRPSVRQAILAGGSALMAFGLGTWALTGTAPWEIPGLLVARIGQTAAGHDMSNLTRFWAWAAAWRLFLEAPLAGVGWGGFGFHFYQIAPVGADAAHFGWPAANNLPLLVLAETGVVGLVLWAVALAPALRSLVAARPSPLAYLLAASCAGILVQGLTFSQWNLPHAWLLLACSAASWYRSRRVV